MHPHASMACTAFDGHHLLASGTCVEVALAVKRALDAGAAGPVQVFDDRSGRPVEFDLRGDEAEVLARLQPPPAAPRGPGRPRLGVMPREVTLLPRHWDWLAGQPGGASAVLRRLVEQAIREGGSAQRAQEASEAVDHFMRAMTGHLPGHEEASRAFWRGERKHFTRLTGSWPGDVRDHLRRLAAIAWDEAGGTRPGSPHTP
ncbi:DUF2239 family protein [Frateuria terrea]|uniref:DUF2239 domain-containing protein n=1 Tax=Frateuria terrea TaxID=529704 RepID=A0A1H6SZX8_9GAMM|nr:DUF2239 family protein [Frateuria terrea]SEI69525.1 hypothetical protein SAMN04487997_1489 [Frateuria terrea]SFP27664.1 hypothetical protein SAMN02927913_1404 [Frateuria terrea]